MLSATLSPLQGPRLGGFRHTQHCFFRQRGDGLGDELVADVAHRADERFTLRAELRAQAPYMYVDSAGAAEVVVAPHLLQQLGAGEDPAGVLREVLQQLELLERQVERRPTDARLVRRLVDAEVARSDLLGAVGLALGRDPAQGEPHAGLDLRWAGAIEEDVVEAPVGGDGRETAFGDDGDERSRRARRAQHPGGGPRRDQVVPGVEDHDVSRRGVDEDSGVEREHPDGVAEQAERRQHVGGRPGSVGEQQQRGHAGTFRSERGPLGDAARRGSGRKNSGVPTALDRFSPARLTLETSDGERLGAVHVAAPGEDKSLGVVVAHGFTGSLAKPGLQAVIQALSAHAGVVAFDFRGHGSSTGVSTLGDREILDLEAAVTHARALGYERIVTCGWSMGGSVVLRHAALVGGVDAVVSVSAVSRWFYKGTKPMRRLHWAVETRLGRVVARRMTGTRISGAGWDVGTLPESPTEVAGRISPIPLLVVHGDRDHYFPLEHPEAIFEAAREPKELWVLEGFGHAESAATPEILDRIGGHLAALVARSA